MNLCPTKALISSYLVITWFQCKNRDSNSGLYTIVTVLERKEKKGFSHCYLYSMSLHGLSKIEVDDIWYDISNLNILNVSMKMSDTNRGKALSWEKRHEIIAGTVEGLVYLHETSNIRIIHRDIKASNILLDSRLRAKIADFGLARSFQEDESHISTAIAGTL